MILPARALIIGTAVFSVFAATAVLTGALPEEGDAEGPGMPRTETEPTPRLLLISVRPPTDHIPSRNQMVPSGQGFALAEAFEPIDDRLERGKRRFGHEARLYVHSSAGELSAGRLAGLSGRSGAYALFSSTGDALGGASPVRTGLFRFPAMNNMLAFRTRTIEGVTAYAMHSFGVEDLESGRYAENDRYLGLGISYETQGSAASITVEQGLPSRTRRNIPAPSLIGLAANTDAGDFRLYGALQYGRHLTDDIADDDADYTYVDGTNIAGTIGMHCNLDKGELRLAAYHARADFSGLVRKTTGVAFRASGTLAPNTYGWFTAGASRTDVAGEDRTDDRLNVHTGLTHVF